MVKLHHSSTWGLLARSLTAEEGGCPKSLNQNRIWSNVERVWEVFCKEVKTTLKM